MPTSFPIYFLNIDNIFIFGSHILFILAPITSKPLSRIIKLGITHPWTQEQVLTL